MGTGCTSPSFIFLWIQKGKETWSQTTFPNSGHFFQPWSSPTSDPALMVLNDLKFCIWLGLTWAQIIREDKVGASLAKGYIFAVMPLDCLTLFGLMNFPNFELVVGRDVPLVQVICPCCHVSSLCNDLWGLQGLFNHFKSQVERACRRHSSNHLADSQTFRVALPNMTTA